MNDILANANKEGWFVVWTESRAEKKVASRLEAQGIELWLPRVTERRRWSDRWREVVLPLFPGYLFVRGAANNLHGLLRTPGVLTVVKHGSKPACLSDGFVASLRAVLENPGVQVRPVPDQVRYALDDEVIVRKGPLAGFRGIVHELRGGHQLVVWIHAIGRGVAFTIASVVVSPVSTTTTQHLRQELG